MKVPENVKHCRECGEDLKTSVNPVNYDVVTGLPAKVRHIISCPRYDGNILNSHDSWVRDEIVGPASYWDRFWTWFDNWM